MAPNNTDAPTAPTAPNPQLDVAVTPAPAPIIPAPNVPPQQAPDLSGLTTPAQQPNLGTAVQGSMAPYEEASQAALQKATAIANRPDASGAPQPHAKLLAMINGLALGMSSFGTAIATRGKEGGAQEVAAVQAQQAQTKIAQQNAAREAKNQALNQQLTIASTNAAQANNVMLLASLPQKFQMQDIELKKGQQDLAAGSLSLASGSADFQSKWGLTPDQFNGSDAVSPQNKSGMADFATQKIGAQARMLQPNDPYVAKAKQTIADSNATPQQIFGAMASVNRQVDLQKEITESQNLATAGLPKNQQEAAAQLAAAQSSGDPTRIAKAQAAKDSIDATVQQEHTFSSNLQQANNVANKNMGMQDTLAQKGIEDVNKLWTDQQHGFSQTLAQASATKNAVAQAKNGSQLAASLEPAMTVLGVNSFAGVHRISPTEYEAAGPAVGSLYRRLNAALDKAGSGSVPQATLSEVNGIMDALVSAKYQESLSSTRQTIANSGIPSNRIFVPSPNDYNTMISLDKVPAAVKQNQNTNANATIPSYAKPR